MKPWIVSRPHSLELFCAPKGNADSPPLALFLFPNIPGMLLSPASFGICRNVPWVVGNRNRFFFTFSLSRRSKFGPLLRCTSRKRRRSPLSRFLCQKLRPYLLLRNFLHRRIRTILNRSRHSNKSTPLTRSGGRDKQQKQLRPATRTINQTKTLEK